MALQTSGAISLNQIHIEAGGTSGTTASLNDSDIRSLNEASGRTINNTSGTEIDFADFYGASAASLSTWPTGAPNGAWGQRSRSHTSFAQAFANYGIKHDQTNDKLHHRWTTGDSGAQSTFSYADQSYTGLDSATVQIKYTASGVNTSGTTSIPSQSSGSWNNVSTSSYSPVFQWSATRTSTGSSSVTSNANGIQFYSRALLNSVYYPSSSGRSSPQRTLALYASISGGGFGGGGCPLCCVHDSMFVAVEEDLMRSIYDINIGDKVISHNFETGQDELVEVTDIVIVERDVDYRVNNLVMTEDHPVYLEGGRKASVNPEATKLNYKQDVDQLEVGDKIMKLDGTLEEVKTIESIDGTHNNFAIQTKHNNFYANGHLVDSVINREEAE